MDTCYAAKLKTQTETGLTAHALFDQLIHSIEYIFDKNFYCTKCRYSTARERKAQEG
jgi:hypothetical protein